MKATDLKKSLKALIDKKVPVFIWGAPGIGKSSIVKETADELSLEFIDLRLSLMDPTDLKGIPFLDKKNSQAVWAKPNFLPKDTSSQGVLFLDEINSAPPSVQASAYQLILDRRVGDYELPKNWSIIAAGNREGDRSVVYKMPSALSNRFIHIDMDVDFDDWKRWAYREGIDSSLISFLNFDKEHLFRFDPAKDQNAFATPRSWEYVDKILKSQIEESLLFENISGAVGRESAASFLNFRSVMDELPDVEAILKGERVDIGNETKVLFATVSSLVSHLKRDSIVDRVDNVIKFSASLPNEFSVLLIKEIQNAKIDLERSKEFERWVERFAHLLDYE
jgi:hypothetical protein